MVAHAGRRLCFTMSVTDEQELVDDRLARLAHGYPGCHVVLIPDGADATGRRWPEGPTVSVRPSKRTLYAVEHGGEIVQRHLEEFLTSGAEWWFKVDPDTVLWRPFRSLPGEMCFFGTIQGGAPGPSLQGGCIGGTRAAALALCASGVLRSTELLDPERSWARGNPNLLARARAGLVSFDFIHAWACRRAAIPLVAHPEIGSEWRQAPAAPKRYAVTHPHKTTDVEGEARAARSRRESAARLVQLIDRSVPVGATVAVMSKGDERLTALGRRRGCHFPADEAGEWAGFHPADSVQAIELLESAQADGVDHFALPETGRWWLDFYDGFARHLASRHRLVAEAPAGRIWALGERA